MKLGIIKAGLAVVSIADSFSAIEIETRLRIANAKALFTQDVIKRNKKIIPLFQTAFQAIEDHRNEINMIVLPCDSNQFHEDILPYIQQDRMIYSWQDVLDNSKEDFESVLCPSDHICNILFSSGTTGTFVPLCYSC
jgi:acetyl-CoA synthetase